MHRFGLPGFCLAMGLLGASLSSPSEAQIEVFGNGNQSEATPKEKILPEFKVEGTSLEVVIALLQKEDPNIRIAFYRDPHAEPDAPFIRLDLKNVTGSDVLNVIGGIHSDIGIKMIGGHAGPIWVVRIAARSTRRANGEVTAGDSGVKVYNLAGAVNGWIMTNMTSLKPAEIPQARKLALDQILSLIQATLSQIPQQPKPVVQVHEPTQTLVFRGSNEQQLAVEDALRALPGGSNGPNGFGGGGGRGGGGVANFTVPQLAAENEALQAKVAEQAQELQKLKGQPETESPAGGRRGTSATPGRGGRGGRGGAGDGRGTPATTPNDQ